MDPSSVGRLMASRQLEDEDDDAQEGATPVTTTPHASIGAEIIPSPPPALETRWPPWALLRVAEGFWFPEVIVKEGLPAVHSYLAPRPTDVILASFPKSGTTWLKALAFATLKRSTHPPSSDADHPLRHRSPHECVRSLEMELNTKNKDEFEALPPPRLLSTHLPYSLLPGGITGTGDDGDDDDDRSGCRIVYICREPKDVLVSFWLFTRKLAPAMGSSAADVRSSSFTIQEAVELFCHGRCLGGLQWKHVLQYWEESVRRPDRVLFLRYEEMLLEPEMHVRKLAKFMGCEFSEEEDDRGVVSAIVEMCSLRKLRDMEVNRNGSTRLGAKNESFFRKGVAGDWINHMTPEMVQRVDKVVQDALQGTGFAFSSIS